MTSHSSEIAAHRGVFETVRGALFLLIVFCGINFPAMPSGFAQGNPPVVSVSAASFEQNAPLAPGSIAAAFGLRLATQTASASGDADPNTPGIQLPTTLGGTTVEVNGVRAGLFFVSPDQINYLIPESAPIGVLNVVVRAGDGAVSNGTARIAAVAPGIFTPTGNGRGVPAGIALRVKPNDERVEEPLFQFNAALNTFTPKPIDFGGEGDQVFLALFATGVRNRASLDGVQLLIGEEQLPVAYAGTQGTFAGLDQINVALPRRLLNLAGLGQIDLALSIRGFAASQTTKVEIARPAPNPPRVTGFNTTNLLAGQTLVINGESFSMDKKENQVFITGADDQTTAQVIAATVSQLTVLIPFGSSSGSVRVSTPLGQAEAPEPLIIRPSISGFIQDNERKPIKDMLVRAFGVGATVSVSTDGAGFFLLPDLRGGSVDIELNGRSETPPLPYPTLKFKSPVKSNGDLQLGVIEMKPIGSVMVPVMSDGAIADSRAVAPVTEEEGQAQGQVVFEFPANATVTFPPGTSGPLVVTPLDRGRTPSKLPPGHFSSTIVQITPFGATISPGGKLTFPNTDGFPAGAIARLFRLDQTPGSPTLGMFVDSGQARVSALGDRVETEPNAVKETSYYFVSLLRQTTTVVGQVVESDQTPVRRTLVVVRGQEVFTDGNGIFVIRNVPVNGTVAPASANEPSIAPAGSQTDSLSVEGAFLRPTALVDRARREGFTPIVGGATRTADLVLPPPPLNRPPLIRADNVFSMSAGTVATFSFSVTDPDPGQSVRVEVTGANFLTLARGSGDLYLLRLSPAANQAGMYTLAITAIDSLGAVATSQVALTVRAP